MTASTRPPRLPVPGRRPAPTCPYVGLVPFDENEAAFFFGRDRESEIIVANLTAARLTLLYAPSGVGKSSVLRAGVVPRLRKLAGEDDDEELGIARSRGGVRQRMELRAAGSRGRGDRARAGGIARRSARPPPCRPRSRPDWLRGAMQGAGVGDSLLDPRPVRGVPLLPPAGHRIRRVDERRSSEIFAARDLNVHVLLSVREDALAGLDRFKGRVPQLFGNYLRLAHLNTRGRP